MDKNDKKEQLEEYLAEVQKQEKEKNLVENKPEELEKTTQEQHIEEQKETEEQKEIENEEIEKVIDAIRQTAKIVTEEPKEQQITEKEKLHEKKTLEMKKPQVIVSLQEYKDHLTRQQKRKAMRTVTVVGLTLLTLIGGKLVFDHWRYRDYTIVKESEQEDTLSTQYVEFKDNVLKISGDDVSLLSRQNEIVWNATHEMENPEVEICQDYFVVYDKKGSSMTVYNKNGKVGEIRTNLPILKARIAKQGVVAVALEDGETTWIKVYSAKGEEIVTAKTRINSPGYPVDLTLSEDGLLMAVSYLNVTDHKLASYVAFYSFSNNGQNQMDNMVSGYTYKEKMVPQVHYFSDGKAVAVRDDGFVIYSGKQIPEEMRTVEVKDEILSTFVNESHFGLVFRDYEGEHPYRIEIYNSSGKEEWTAPLDLAFDHVQFSKDRVILYNDTEFAVYTMGGACRYQGSFEDGNIRNIFKTAGNRYMVITDAGIETIKLG